MELPTHIIQKLFLEVEVEGHMAPHTLRETLMQWLKNEFSPWLEQWLDSQDIVTNQTVAIEKLSIPIEVNRLSANDLPENVFVKIEEQLNKLLIQRIKTVQATSIVDKTLKTNISQKIDPFISTNKSKDVESEFQLKSSKKRLLEAFVLLLRKGFLPWWMPTKEGLTIEEKLLKEISITANTLVKLIHFSSDSKTIEHRVVKEFSNEFFAAILSELEQQHEVQTIQQLLSLVSDNQLSIVSLTLPSKINLLHWMATSDTTTKKVVLSEIVTKIVLEEKSQLIRQWLSSTNSTSLKSALKTVFHTLLQRGNKISNNNTEAETIDDLSIKNVLSTETLNSINPEDLTILIKQILDSPEAGKKVEQITDKEVSSQDLQHKDSTNKNSEDEKVEFQNSVNPNSKDEKDVSEKVNNSEQLLEEDESIYVVNSGLVLLHPFIGFYFEKMGWMANNEFNSVSNQMLAIKSLYYLACKQEDPKEFELSLCKLLCGWPILFPLEESPELSKDAKDEAETLLEAVIGYWEKLSNSNPDLLRGTFLTREGKLTEDHESFLLQVEPGAYDILMADLPWGISIIQNQWMTKRLDVEWLQ